MKQFWFFIIIFIFSLLQAAFLPINLVFLFAVSLSILNGPAKGAFWAFIAGILLDLSVGSFLGLSSIGFLVICLFANLYKRKFLVKNIFYLSIFSFAGLWIFNLIAGRMMGNLEYVLTALLIIPVFPIFEILEGYFVPGDRSRLDK